MVKMFTGIKTFDGVIFYKIYVFFYFSAQSMPTPAISKYGRPILTFSG